MDYGEAAVAGGIHPEPLAGQENRGNGGGRQGGDGGHGILQAMVQEDATGTSNWIQPETP
jgi:hypothetical protein